jgi:beta-lactamase class A
MLKQKIPAFYLVIAAVLGCAITFLIIHLAENSAAAGANNDNGSTGYDSAGGYKIIRYKSDYKYISPILSVEPIRESEKYSHLKSNISDYIEKEKKKGVASVSVYVRDFSLGEWIAIDPDEKYDPGSLLKVGVLITYLKMAEIDTGLTGKEVVYHGQKGFVFPVEHFRSDTVIEGHKYRIRDLMEYMIRNSDNRATLFLEDHMDTTIFKNEFSDMGMAVPDFRNPNYMLNVKEYSMMLKALYNAGYIRKRSSERALGLLTESAFKDGIMKELPSSLIVAHKFGEAGNGVTHELHETGIVYLQNNPYMITIMTKGNDWNELSAAIGHISRMVYDNMAAIPNSH